MRQKRDKKPIFILKQCRPQFRFNLNYKKKRKKIFCPQNVVLNTFKKGLGMPDLGARKEVINMLNC